MCGRYTLTTTARQIAEYFAVNEVPALAPRELIRPTEAVPIIRQNGERKLDMARWGLIPSWWKQDKPPAALFNARAETIDEKPSFRSAFKHHRCLVVADGFFESQPIPGSKKKQPYWIGREDKGLIAFAGLWEEWTNRANGEVIESCTIITTDANQDLAFIHDRMPVILEPEQWAMWLGDGNGEELKGLLRPYAGKLEMVVQNQ